MIQIERLRLRLPAGFEHRAASIARTVGKVLAKQSVSQQLSIDAVTLTAQKIHANTSDEEIAQMIVRQLLDNHAGASA